MSRPRLVFRSAFLPDLHSVGRRCPELSYSVEYFPIVFQRFLQQYHRFDYRRADSPIQRLFSCESAASLPVQ
ncbi:hypothetical protein Aperf_G00000028420 [Anoplocephala perfoliata]